MIKKNPIRDRQGLTEAEYLGNYQADDFKHPSVATDMAIFTITEKAEANYRKLSEKQLSILLIQRGVHPYLGYWALPGGFVRPDETTDQAAKRELFEETGLKQVYMEQLYTFSDPGRDPRTWVMSCSYMALIDSSQFHLQAGDDADNAKWFSVSFHLLGEHKRYQHGTNPSSEEAPKTVRSSETPESPHMGASDSTGSCRMPTAEKGSNNPAEIGIAAVVLTQRYKLTLSTDDTILYAVIQRKLTQTEHSSSIEYDILENEGLAFDHAKIIAYALERLRGKVEYTGLALHLMPSRFTLTQLQQVYEAILGKQLLKPAFRRKIAALVEETDYYTENEGHRPSRLYRRKWEKL